MFICLIADYGKGDPDESEGHAASDDGFASI
jgi:hypothetical protein